MTGRRLSLFVVLASIFSVLLMLPAAANGTPVSEKKQRAQEIRRQVAALDHQLEGVIEQYNYANEKLQGVREQIHHNTKNLKIARYNLDVAHHNLSARVVALYKERPVDLLDVVFSAQSFDEITSQLDLMKKLGEHDTDIIHSVETYKRQIQQNRVGLISDRKAATKLVAEVTTKKTKITSTLAKRKQMLHGVEAEIRRIEAAEAAAAARRLAAATGTGTTTPGTTPNQRPIIPSQAGPGHPEVCAIAARYLGTPYLYAGASPSTGFDCSGFVMYVYAQIGISLPHYSGAQQQMGTPVSMNALAPGDLVFRGNPAYHVGIYVGGGTVIHSPHTGAVVSYESVSGWESAVRL